MQMFFYINRSNFISIATVYDKKLMFNITIVIFKAKCLWIQKGPASLGRKTGPSPI